MISDRQLFGSIITILFGAVLAVFAQQNDEDQKRCFLVAEGVDAATLKAAVAEVYSIGMQARDLDELQRKLSSVGRLSLSRFSGYSVLTIAVGKGNFDALNKEVFIHSFKGSPYGLLKRVAQETGVNWDVQRFHSSTEHGWRHGDISTAIHVENFQGTVRQLLAATIPPSYASFAFTVLCRADGRVEVRHIGQNQFPTDLFPADRRVKPLPRAVRLTTAQQEMEGMVIVRKKGEPDVDFEKRLRSNSTSRTSEKERK